MLTREQQKEKRRMDILQIALDLFVKNGYSATKIETIAKEAHMSVGLLFHYFKSKEKLYEELIKMGLEGTQAPLQMDYETPIAFFEGFLTQLFLYAKEQPWVAKMFLLMAHAAHNTSTPVAVREIALQVNTIKPSAEIIKQGQLSGHIRQGDPLALANAYWCSVHGIMEQLALQPDLPCPEVEWIIDIIRSK